MKIQRSLSYTGGALIIIVILIMMLMALLPSTLRWYANGWFADQGLASEINNIEINLTDGQFVLEGLTVKNIDSRVLSVDHLSVKVDMRDLFNKKLSLEKVDLNGLYVDVVRDESDVIKVAGIGSRSDSSGAEMPDHNNDPDVRPWGLSLAKVTINDVVVCYKIVKALSKTDYHGCASFDVLDWSGKAEYTLYAEKDKALDGFNALFNVTLSGLNLKDKLLGRTAIRFDDLIITDADFRGVNNAHVKMIELSNYQALQTPIIDKTVHQASFLLSSKQFVIEDLLIKDNSEFDINNLAVNGFVATIKREEDGDLEINRLIKSFSPPVARSIDSLENKGGKESNAPVIRISQFSIGGESVVKVYDAAVEPVFQNKIRDIQLTIKDIDSASAAMESQLNLGLVVGEHGTVKSEGRAQLFSHRPTISLKAKIVGINIGEFDAYAKQVVQHQVNSGHLDADLNINIKQGELDSKADVTLHKFYVETLDEKSSNQYKEKLGVPLASALSLLREKDDSISIQMPVTGDIENPDFSINDIVRKVSADAIKAAVINYYTPFDLVKLLTAGFNLATALRFEPVPFDAGQTGLDAQYKTRLEKLAELLNERPRIHLVLCGHSTRQDFIALYPEDAVMLEKAESDTEKSESGAMGEIIAKKAIDIDESKLSKLNDVANNRGKAVKKYLHEILGISSDRLILCNPKFDYADQGDSRVEITI